MKIIASIFIFLLSIHTSLGGYVYSDPIKITDKLQESFSKLQGADGATVAFDQGKTLIGWYSSESSYVVSDGTNNKGALYSYGDSPARALGAQNSNSNKRIVFGISIISDVEIHEVKVEFTAQQWRYGGYNPDNDVLSFDYSVLTTRQYESGGWGGNKSANTNNPAWIAVPELYFYGSNKSNTTGHVLSTQQFSHSVSTPDFGPDKVLQLRWTAYGNHDGLAISAFQVHATQAPPEHKKMDHQIWKMLAIIGWGLMAVVVAGLVIFAVRRRRRRQAKALRKSYGENVNNTGADIGIYNAYRGLPTRGVEAHERQSLLQP